MNREEKIKVGISSCLLGEHVRYDGGHRRDHYLTDTLGQYVDWVPVCPEVESGLPVPREAMRLVGSSGRTGLVTIKTKIDYTNIMIKWIEKKLKRIEKEELCGFIFKSRSPSCGIRGVKIYFSSGMPSRCGSGLFGGAFLNHYPLMPVEDEDRLHNPVFRENFICRIFVFRRWREYLKKDGSVIGLKSFHSEHELLAKAHSPGHYEALGTLLTDTKKTARKLLFPEYISTLMDGLKLIATVKKKTNILRHIAGYFKKNISSDEKKELFDIINKYHAGLVPLIVPVTLLNHYVRKYHEPYLKTQHYLNPHPLELMLRN
jgi:uncharacterized protein YbgA (DUF1722 family)/uncharacterized protein YbbK (DUF523 family)